MTEEMLDSVFSQLSEHRRFLTGIHIAGGEPLLNPALVMETIRKAKIYRIPIDYVETNAFWCWNDEKTESVFRKLTDTGLCRILISVSPFHLEFIPMDRVHRAVSIAGKIFGIQNVYIYTQYFLQQFNEIDPYQPLPLEDYLEASGYERAAMAFATEYALVPNGRAALELDGLYQHLPAEHFFGGTCEKELLNPHHIHIDPYGNYIAGLCAGLSLGDAACLKHLFEPQNFQDRPVIERLLEGGVETLYKWAVSSFGFKPRLEGYIAKCQLCLGIRRFLHRQSTKWSELQPDMFYEELETPVTRLCAVPESSE